MNKICRIYVENYEWPVQHNGSGINQRDNGKYFLFFISPAKAGQRNFIRIKKEVKSNNFLPALTNIFIYVKVPPSHDDKVGGNQTIVLN